MPNNNGRKILEGVPTITIAGLPVALIGMKASCQVCKGVGAITPLGPHLQTFNDIPVALRGISLLVLVLKGVILFCHWCQR
ncbi:PAAR domain-containing protein [Buttiauxella agrestis]